MHFAKISAVFFASLLFVAPASAVKFSAVGAMIQAEPKLSNGSTYTAKNSYGGGALLEFGLGPIFGFEIGALSLPRKYEFANINAGITSSVVATQKMLQVPVLFRAYLGKVLSLGFGGYYAKYNGSYAFETTTLGVKTTGSSTYAAAGLSDSDYGFVSSIALYIPMAPMFRIILDGRYTVGVKDNSTTTTEMKFNDIQALAGFQLGF
jgi:hypothetical protein